MRKYEYREEGCDRCNYEEVEVIKTESFRGTENLCCFCYETHLGNILEYPKQHPGQETLVRGLIESFHILLKAGKK